MMSHNSPATTNPMSRQKNHRKIKIAIWNAASLNQNRRNELLHFMKTRDVDIALISETRLKKGQSSYIQGYKCYRRDEGQGSSRGVAIYTRISLDTSKIPEPQIPNIHLEHVGVTVKRNNQPPLNVHSIYLSPSLPLIFGELDKLLETNLPTIIGGDFNCKHQSWKCPLNNPNGIKLLRYVDSRRFVMHHPNDPTHIPNVQKYRPSIIDFFISNNITNLTKPITQQDLSSDHNPVEIEINSNFTTTQSLHFNYAKADWDSFTNHLDTYTPLTSDIPLSIRQVEAEIKHLTETIQKEIDNCIPKAGIVINSYQIDERIKKLINTRNFARKKWQSTRHPVYRNIKNKMSKRIQYAIQMLKNKHVEEEIKKLSTKDNTLWKNVKKFKKKSTKINHILSNGNQLIDSKDIADSLAENFEASHQMNQMDDIETEELVEESMNTLEAMTVWTDEQNEELYINLNEIKQIIKNLRNKKAPGEDRIQGIVVKKLPNNVLDCLVDIINSCIHHDYYPDAWKNALVIPIHKPGKKPELAASYRPISLLPLFGKLYEKILLTRLHNEGTILCQQEQFGFRKGHSSCHQLARVIQDVSRQYTRKIPTIMVFLDIEKAFDRVWHDGLVHKLLIAGVNPKLIKIIKSYLSNRTFQVSYNNVKSRKALVGAGVPQGSLIGPILFNLYIKDIPTTPPVKTALYADDTAVYISGKFGHFKSIPEHLQTHLNKLDAFYHKWKIKINPEKTEGLIFKTITRKTPKHDHIKKLHFQGIPITWKDDVKYLGCKMDSKLTWSKHITYAINKARAGIRILYPLINNKSSLKTSLKILLYKTMISPVLTYANPVWHSANKTDHKRIQIIQNKYLRIIHDTQYKHHSTKELHKLSNIAPIYQKQTEILQKFHDKIKENTNPLIKEIGSLKYLHTSGIHHRRKLLTIPKQNNP